MDPKWRELTTVVYLGCGHVRTVPLIVNPKSAATHPGLCEDCFNGWDREHSREVLASWEVHVKDGGD